MRIASVVLSQHSRGRLLPRGIRQNVQPEQGVYERDSGLTGRLRQNGPVRNTSATRPARGLHFYIVNGHAPKRREIHVALH